MIPKRILRAGALAAPLLFALTALSFESGCDSGAATPGSVIKDPAPAPEGEMSSDDYAKNHSSKSRSKSTKRVRPR
jgi:hypothetical protein